MVYKLFPLKIIIRRDAPLLRMEGEELVSEPSKKSENEGRTGKDTFPRSSEQKSEEEGERETQFDMRKKFSLLDFL